MSLIPLISSDEETSVKLISVNPHKIDIHAHTSNRLLKHTVTGDARIKPTILNWMETEHIDHSVLLASYFPHRGSGISNFRLANWINKYQEHKDQLLMFGSLDCNFYFKQGMSELEELADGRVIRGIKVYTGYQDVTNRHLLAIGSLADRFRLPIMFHTGYIHVHDHRNVDRAFNPNDLVSFIERFPNVSVILSHLGNPFFDVVRNLVNRFPKVYSDTSGLIDSFDKSQRDDISKYSDEVSKFLVECGPSKLLWGSDFPVQTYWDTSTIVGEGMNLASITDNEREQVLYYNAAEILGLTKKEEPKRFFGSRYD